MNDQPQQPKGGEVRPQARNHDVVIKELSEEILIYDLKIHKAYCLNKTAAIVWKHCDGQKTTEDITAQLKQETNMLVNEAAVNLALYQLGNANLLEQNSAFIAAEARQSRREILRRLGTAAALPLVTTIVAPLAVQAQTCGPTNNNSNLNAVGCPCSGAAACASGCCGFSAAVGNICVTSGSVQNNDPCRANCECASKKCPSATRICTA
jgi:hypothetical protein